MKIIIIGGDAAGMSAASKIKRRCPDYEVLVFEKTGDVSYSACGMPYNIADPDRSVEDLVVRSADVFIEKNKIDLRVGHEVTEIDRSQKQVRGKDAEGKGFAATYDRLLIATGAAPAELNVPGGDLPGVLPLKSLENARQIKTYLDHHAVRRVVIIGMGYIGLEMCEALRARDIQVAMVKPRSVFLPWMDREPADAVRQEVENNGVNLNCGHDIKAIATCPDGGMSVKCNDLELKADLVISASGVRPLSDLASAAGLAIGASGAVAVDHAMRTSDPDIYAAGDCADAFHVVTGERCWIPLALRANRAGWAVADHICGEPVRIQGVAGTAVFKVFEMQVARTGLTLDEARDAGFDPAAVTIKSRSKAHSHPGSAVIHAHMVGDRKTGRLLGMQMTGTDGVAHRINAPAVALHAGMRVTELVQCDLAYAPPFGPVWDPVLTAGNQLLKKLE